MKKTLFVTKAGFIAALYVVLTYVSSVLGLSSGVIQCRFSEALCILPVFTSAAVPGVTIGCMISNLITSGNIFDVVLGSCATLIGAYGAYLMRHGKLSAYASLPTVLSNGLIIPLALKLMGIPDVAYIYTAFTVAVGEVLSCTVLGTLLAHTVRRSSLEKYLKD